MSKNGKKIQYVITIVVSLAAMTSSVALSWTAPIITKLHNNETKLKITDNEISWMLALSSPGIITGCVVARFVSDHYGRRPTLLASAFPFIAGTIFVLNAYNAWMLFIARYIWGCGSGMISTVSTIYLAEISHKDIRGKLSVANRFMFNFGTLIVLTIGSFVSYEMLSYLLIVFPLCYFMACWWIPETPYYLLKENMVDKARKELQKLSGSEDAKEVEEKLTLMSSDVRTEMSRSGTLKELFTGKQYRRALIISTGLRITKMLSGSITITQYLGPIIEQSNVGVSGSTALIIFGIVRFVVGLFASMVVDKFGRRPIILYSFMSGCVCLTIIGACFFVQEVAGIQTESSSPVSQIIFVGINVFNVIATFGFDTLIFVIPAETFPLNVKSVAMTFLNTSGAVINFIGFIGYQRMKDLTGLYGVFWCFALIAFIGAVFTYTTVPETKGKSLREIQIELYGNIYDDAIDESDVKTSKHIGGVKDITVVEMKTLDRNGEQSNPNR